MSTPASSRAVEVVPMKYHEILAARGSLRRAFEDEPMVEYFVGAEKYPQAWMSVRDYFHMIGGIYQQRVLTVDGGAAVIKYSWHGNSDQLPILMFILRTFAKLFLSVEGMKRFREFIVKAHEIGNELFGERIKDMYEIQTLATNPAAQGRGYGSALVRHVINKAGADGRDVWLITTDARRFYEALGFTAIRSVTLGEDNPSWDKEPVVFHVMLYKTSSKDTSTPSNGHEDD